MTVYTTMRDELLLMCRAADIPVQKEPLHLLLDELPLRPGDLFIPNMKTDDFIHTRHAIDFTAPSVDSNWHNIPRHQQEKRSKTISSR